MLEGNFTGQVCRRLKILAAWLIFITLNTMLRRESEILFAEALNYIPGGVNSRVRVFRAVGGQPFFVNKAKVCCVCDVDGNEYKLPKPRRESNYSRNTRKNFSRLDVPRWSHSITAP